MKRNTERDAAICRLYGEGVGTLALAIRYGISQERVRQVLKAAGQWAPGGRVGDRAKSVREPREAQS